tara:strand:- start:251 stop:436 length:186 start_codon:yes stop_codon:yes gene_type:complete
MNDEFYLNNMDDLYVSVNNLIELLEESVGTCTDEKMMPLLEEAHTALEQLASVMSKYAKSN